MCKLVFDAQKVTMDMNTALVSLIFQAIVSGLRACKDSHQPTDVPVHVNHPTHNAPGLVRTNKDDVHADKHEAQAKEHTPILASEPASELASSE